MQAATTSFRASFFLSEQISSTISLFLPYYYGSRLICILNLFKSFEAASSQQHKALGDRDQM